MWPKQFSITPRSGLLGGRKGGVDPNRSKNSSMTSNVWIGALLCWKTEFGIRHSVPNTAVGGDVTNPRTMLNSCSWSARNVPSLPLSGDFNQRKGPFPRYNSPRTCSIRGSSCPSLWKDGTWQLIKWLNIVRKKACKRTLHEVNQSKK